MRTAMRLSRSFCSTMYNKISRYMDTNEERRMDLIELEELNYTLIKQQYKEDYAKGIRNNMAVWNKVSP